MDETDADCISCIVDGDKRQFNVTTYAWYGTNNKVERQLSRRAVLHLYWFKEHRKGKSNFSYEKESENDRGKYLPKDHFFCNSIVSGKSVPAIV